MDYSFPRNFTTGYSPIGRRDIEDETCNPIVR